MVVSSKSKKTLKRSLKKNKYLKQNIQTGGVGRGLLGSLGGKSKKLLFGSQGSKAAKNTKKKKL